jgi:hypothetical protein
MDLPGDVVLLHLRSRDSGSAKKHKARLPTKSRALFLSSEGATPHQGSVLHLVPGKRCG